MKIPETLALSVDGASLGRSATPRSARKFATAALLVAIATGVAIADNGGNCNNSGKNNDKGSGGNCNCNSGKNNDKGGNCNGNGGNNGGGNGDAFLPSPVRTVSMSPTSGPSMGDQNA